MELLLKENKILQIISPSSIKTIKLFNHTGCLVSVKNETENTIDISSLKQGIYLACVTDLESNFYTQKFEIEK